MTDPAIIGAVGTIIISVLSIVGGYLLKMHIKQCKCCKIYCECIEKEKKEEQIKSNKEEQSKSYKEENKPLSQPTLFTTSRNNSSSISDVL